MNQEPEYPENSLEYAIVIGFRTAMLKAIDEKINDIRANTGIPLAVKLEIAYSKELVSEYARKLKEQGGLIALTVLYKPDYDSRNTG